jgi:hypothetical protein
VCQTLRAQCRASFYLIHDRILSICLLATRSGALLAFSRTLFAEPVLCWFAVFSIIHHYFSRPGLNRRWIAILFMYHENVWEPRKRLGMAMHWCRYTGNSVVVSPDVDCTVSISCFMIYDVQSLFVLVFASSTCGGYVDVYHLGGSVLC